MDFTATDAAEQTGISRRSVTDIYRRLRQKIARWSERKPHWPESLKGMNPASVGSEFPANAAAVHREKRSSLASSNARGKKVYPHMVPDARKMALQRVIRGKVRPASVIRSDGCGGMTAW